MNKSQQISEKLKQMLIEYSEKEGWTSWDKGNLHGICLAIEAVEEIINEE